MRYPNSRDFSMPCADQPGWPWTEGTPQLPDTMPDGRPWPLISIVTPSYNQAQYLEETIRSILLQGYPNLEYIIIDGGSTDGSIDIIRRYEPWLAYWVSEPDQGQADAINKGWRRCRGEIVAWLNSDDTYEPDALRMVAQEMNSEKDHPVVYGDCNFIDETGRFLRTIHPPPLSLGSLIRYWVPDSVPPQPAIFLSLRVIQDVGLLNTSLHYAMDYDLCVRAISHYRFHHIPRPLANYRYHSESKTGHGWQPFFREWHDVSYPYWNNKKSSLYYRFWIEISLARILMRLRLNLGIKRRLQRQLSHAMSSTKAR